jgi:hypothetical protein
MGRNGEYFVRLRRLKGHNVGFVKNMSIGALVTVATDTLTIERIMLNSIDVDSERRYRKVGI